MIDVGQAGDRDAAWLVADPGRSARSARRRSRVPVVARARAATGFAGYKVRLAERARREGISEATIAATIPGLTLNSRVIALDRAQPGGVNNPNAYPPFAPYRRQHVNAVADHAAARRAIAPMTRGSPRSSAASGSRRRC